MTEIDYSHLKRNHPVQAEMIAGLTHGADVIG